MLHTSTTKIIADTSLRHLVKCSMRKAIHKSIIPTCCSSPPPVPARSRCNIKKRVRATWHASVKVTADTYLHVTKKIEDDALALYERYVK